MHMDRRQFSKALGIGTVGLTMSRNVLSSPSDAPQIAITIDDFNLFGATQIVAEQRNQSLLAALRRHHNLKAAAFICGKNIDSEMEKVLCVSGVTPAT
jgi:hypothetical protein